MAQVSMCYTPLCSACGCFDMEGTGTVPAQVSQMGGTALSDSLPRAGNTLCHNSILSSSTCLASFLELSKFSFRGSISCVRKKISLQMKVYWCGFFPPLLQIFSLCLLIETRVSVVSQQISECLFCWPFFCRSCDQEIQTWG